jgi:hypothetical protein
LKQIHSIKQIAGEAHLLESQDKLVFLVQQPNEKQEREKKMDSRKKRSPGEINPNQKHHGRPRVPTP